MMRERDGLKIEQEFKIFTLFILKRFRNFLKPEALNQTVHKASGIKNISSKSIQDS